VVRERLIGPAHCSCTKTREVPSHPDSRSPWPCSQFIQSMAYEPNHLACAVWGKTSFISKVTPCLADYITSSFRRQSLNCFSVCTILLLPVDGLQEPVFHAILYSSMVVAQVLSDVLNRIFTAITKKKHPD